MEIIIYLCAKNHTTMKRLIFVSMFLCPWMTTMAQGEKQCPPITPAWALGHIVWEDSLNTTAAAEGLVYGYLERHIPVDAVIIDSPWSTSYNDFNWDKQRYADPAKMIKGFSDKGVRTILWLTGNVNEQCKDTPQQKSATVPGPGWEPIRLPTLLISTLPSSLANRSSIRSATALASS